MKRVLLSFLLFIALLSPLAAQDGPSVRIRTTIPDTLSRTAAAPRQEQDPAEDTAARDLKHKPRWSPALSTNLLSDLALVPDLGLEFPLGRRWSLAAAWHYAWWFRDPQHLYWQTYGGKLAVRYYFRTSRHDVLNGHHLGVYGQVLTYDFEFGGRGEQAATWQYGAGLEYGYTFRLSRTLRLDLHLGVGYMGGRYERYDPEYGYYVWKETLRRHWLGPTTLGVTFMWMPWR